MCGGKPEKRRCAYCGTPVEMRDGHWHQYGMFNLGSTRCPNSLRTDGEHNSAWRPN